MNVKKFLGALSLSELLEVQRGIMPAIEEAKKYKVKNLRESLGYSFQFALECAGVDDIRELKHWKLKDLQKLSGIGPKKARELEKILNELGVKLED